MPNRHEFHIEDHKIVALGFNEDKSGTPAIFLHGITGSLGFWRHVQTPIFNDQFRWYSLSLPGHYPAEFPIDFRRDDLTAELIARLLAQGIRELVGEQPVLLVGHSTGGFAALSIAAHTPERVKGIISISGFAHGKWTGGLGSMQKLVRWGGRLGEKGFIFWYGLNQKSRRINRPMWRIYAVNSHQMYRTVEPVYDDLFESFTHLNLENMVDYFSRMPDIDITPLLSSIQVPVLALAGERDPIAPPSQARVIADNVQNGQLQYIPKTGHLPMYEDPKGYHQAITNWLQNTFLS